MRVRTAQQILAERRAAVDELRLERDPIGKGLLSAVIATLDAELKAFGSSSLDLVAAKRVVLAAHLDIFGHQPGNEFDLDAAARALLDAPA